MVVPEIIFGNQICSSKQNDLPKLIITLQSDQQWNGVFSEIANRFTDKMKTQFLKTSKGKLTLVLGETPF
jgi:hypothetical protein